MNQVLEELITAEVQVDANVPVKSVSIDEDTRGQEDIERVPTCTAEGGRPLPTLSWSLQEHLEDQTTEESNSLEDGTFTPSTEENEMVVSCEAINEVIEDGTVKMVASLDSANTKIVTSMPEATDSHNHVKE